MSRPEGITDWDNLSALRGMIVEFVFFMAIAAICFSGLLFTLWTLGEPIPLPHVLPWLGSAHADVPATGYQTWSVKSIMWLMVQIWFGNTYLSFAQGWNTG